MSLSLSDLEALIADPAVGDIHAAAHAAHNASMPSMGNIPSTLGMGNAGAVNAAAKPTQPPLTPDQMSRMPSLEGPSMPASTSIPSLASEPSIQKPQSFWQKLGHGLATAGNIAGDVFAPGTMALIPGTQLNKEVEQNRAAKLAGAQSETGLRNAQTGEANANAWKALHPNPTTPFEAFEVGNPDRVEDYEKLLQESGKTPEERFIDSEIGEGKTFGQAFNDMNAAKNTSGKTPAEQTYADLIKQGKTSEEALAAVTKAPTDSAAQDTARAEQIRQAQLLGTPVSPEDAAWLKAHTAEKTAVPQFNLQNRAEQGSYVPVPDPTDPIHKIIGWVDPKSGNFRSLQDIPGMAGNNEIKPTGQAASREEQAAVIGRAGDGLIQDVQQNRSKIGDVGAIVESAFLGTPLADPQQAELATEIASFAALQPAMHGFRGSDALKAFQKMIGGIPNNPDALIASIKGIQKTAGYFNPNQASSTSQIADGTKGTWNGKPVIRKDGKWQLAQ